MREYGLAFAPGGAREPKNLTQERNNKDEAAHRFQHREMNLMNTPVENVKPNHTNGINLSSNSVADDSAKQLTAALGDIAKELHDAGSRQVRTVKSEAFDNVSLSLKAIVATASVYLTYRGLKTLLPGL
ncbi:hypothetical protein LVJ94_35330 [Pendulispora rubella]|uniref:Peroxin-14 n=1 Tax=Pendulispora rubella TaxID=2741070 RepID=A0ABZ2KX94_9BACT